jgi:hypothetical protein
VVWGTAELGSLQPSHRALDFGHFAANVVLKDGKRLVSRELFGAQIVESPPSDGLYFFTEGC